MLLRKILLIGLCLSAEANQEIKIIGDNNIVKQIIYKGLSPQTVTKFMKPYKERIIYLEGQLRNTVSIEEKYRLSEELDKAKKISERKNEEIRALNKFIENSNLKVVREATKIYEEKGLEATLEYFQSQNFKKFEKNTEKNMKKLAGGYMFQAKILKIYNKYDQAKEAYKKALKYDRSMENLYDISTFLYTQQYYNEAIRYYNEIIEKMKLEENSSQLQYMFMEVSNKLALSYVKVNKIEDAKKIYRRAITAYKGLKGAKDIHQSHLIALLSRIYGNLGHIYSDEGNFKEAKKLQLKALKITRRLIKEDNLELKYQNDLAYRLLNIGTLYARMGEKENAKKYFIESLKIFQKSLLQSRDTKVIIGVIYDNLGFLYENSNQIKKAENFYKEALIIKKNLVKINPRAYSSQLSKTIIQLGNFYKNQQNIEKAKKTYLEILKIKKNLTQYNSKIFLDNVLNGLINLGEIYFNEENFKKSEELYLKALAEIDNINNLYKIALIEHNEYQRKKSKIFNYLGLIYFFKNKKIQAKKYYKQSLEIRKSLMKISFNDYSILFTKSLIIGVLVYGEPIKTLDIAKEILEKQKKINKKEAKFYLDKIEEIKNDIANRSG